MIQQEARTLTAVAVLIMAAAGMTETVALILAIILSKLQVASMTVRAPDGKGHTIAKGAGLGKLGRADNDMMKVKSALGNWNASSR